MKHHVVKYIGIDRDRFHHVEGWFHSACCPCFVNNEWIQKQGGWTCEEGEFDHMMIDDAQQFMLELLDLYHDRWLKDLYP